jgi:hypothetical protein
MILKRIYRNHWTPALLVLVLVLVGCTLSSPSTFHLQSQRTWGKNAYIFGSGSTLYTIQLNPPLSLTNESLNSIGNCEIDRHTEEWICKRVRVAIENEPTIASISTNTLSPEETIAQIKKVGYYNDPRELSEKFSVWLNGQRTPSRVFLIGQNDVGLVFNVFFANLQMWVYLKDVNDLSKVLDAFEIHIALPDEIFSLLASFAEETKVTATGTTIAMGGKHFTVPETYATSPSEIWSLGLYSPGGYCVKSGTNTQDPRDAEVVSVTNKTRWLHTIRFSSPSQCNNLLETDDYCFQRVEKEILFGKGKIRLTYVYNDPSAVILDTVRMDPITGRHPCKPYKITPEKFLWAEGCRADGICVYSYFWTKPEELEALLRGITEN